MNYFIYIFLLYVIYCSCNNIILIFTIKFKYRDPGSIRTFFYCEAGPGHKIIPTDNALIFKKFAFLKCMIYFMTKSKYSNKTDRYLFCNEISCDMGIITSKDTRRITFDNTIVMSPTLISKPIEDISNILAIDKLDENKSSEINYKDTSSRLVDLRDEDYDYWTHRIESLRNDHQLISKIIEEEYQKTINDTKILFHSAKITEEKIKKIKPCFDWRAKILQCYEDNPRQPLMCSALVEAFSNCVTSCQLED